MYNNITKITVKQIIFNVRFDMLCVIRYTGYSKMETIQV